jgi:hypothetical protein
MQSALAGSKRFILLATLAVLANGCSCGNEEPLVACQADSCSGHGACDASSGKPVCSCEPGWSGERCDACAAGYHSDGANCVADTQCLESTCSGHGSCDASSGAPVCACEAGYSGSNCASCAAGFQDNDADGTCAPDCSIAAPLLSCVHGTCSDSSGQAACACEPGYGGESCDSCAAGFALWPPELGSCVDDPCDPSPCSSAHETGCQQTGETSFACLCAAGWSGADCSECAGGFHLEGGACVVDRECLPTTCSNHGTCDDGTGMPVCSCDSGYAGPACGSCAAGFQDNDLDHSCLPDCTSAAPDCGGHGTCSDADGTTGCACFQGYAGDACNQCAPGYQDNDADGSCLPTCDNVSLACGAHGRCSDTSGTAACACDAGYSGESCDSCASGWQDHDGDAACQPTCETAALDCGQHGSCADSTGTAVCVCAEGYAGTGCAGCASGYQDKNGDGTCLPDCATAGLACGPHGACVDTSGTATCSCEAAYSGADCASCADGYQDFDGDKTCLPTCATAAPSCGHGSCSHSTGTATCVCDAGYVGSACDACDSGYQDNDHDRICLPTCAGSGTGASSAWSASSTSRPAARSTGA